MSPGQASPAAGLILAAGAGTRFGATPKQLSDVLGRPLLEWAIAAQCAVAPELLSPIVVVLGARAAEVRAGVDFGRARAVDCADWASGQSASLRHGLEALAGAERVLVTLGDAPLLSTAVIARFAAEPGGTRASFGGVPGHPVILGPAHRRALSELSGDRGARGLLRDARMIEVGHLCSGRDVDTPDDLEEVRSALRAVI